MTVFIPGKLRNFDNGAHGHWSKKASYRKRWREAVMLCIRQEKCTMRPNDPKTITLTAHVWNRFDAHDGLRSALKPCIDGLVDAGVIQGDGPRVAHDFRYAQCINRHTQGVYLEIDAAP